MNRLTFDAIGLEALERTMNLAAQAQIIASTANGVAPDMLDVPGSYQASPGRAGGAVVQLTASAWHLAEFGSGKYAGVRSRPFAPVQKGADAAGARLFWE